MNIKQRMKVKEIAEMTQNNDHCGALSLGITMVTDKTIRDDLLERMSVVEYHQNLLGYMSPQIYSDRYEIYKEFKAIVIQEFSAEDYSKIYDAF